MKMNGGRGKATYTSDMALDAESGRLDALATLP